MYVTSATAGQCYLTWGRHLPVKVNLFSSVLSEEGLYKRKRTFGELRIPGRYGRSGIKFKEIHR